MKPPPKPPAAITSARVQVRAALKPNGAWAYPFSNSGTRYHFVELGATHCLCGRWKRSELRMQNGEVRDSLSHVDAKACVRVYTQRYKHINDY